MAWVPILDSLYQQLLNKLEPLRLMRRDLLQHIYEVAFWVVLPRLVNFGQGQRPSRLQELRLPNRL
jgi:hypothetical protein